MYLVLNQNEVLSSVARRMLAQRLKKIQPVWTHTDTYLTKCQKRQDKSGLISIDFNQINLLLVQDLEAHTDRIVALYKQQLRGLTAWLAQRWDSLPMSHEDLVRDHVSSRSTGFIKQLAAQLTLDPVWCLAGNPVPDDHSVIIRNIINNQDLLAHRLAQHLPFWFVDSGYTNFLEPNKRWHRLVQDHIHATPGPGYYPADRLNLLPVLPKPWRKEGSKIIVVCSSSYHYALNHTTQDAWQATVKQQLRRFTDRAIEFRLKDVNMKKRTSLYEDLATDDEVYCVISDSSAAAVEAIWLGIPVITLQQHITAPVARTTFYDINNLYRGALGDWLCALTYSQFTKKEMLDGTALKLVQQYHV